MQLAIRSVIGIFALLTSAQTFAAQGKTTGQFSVSPWGSAQYRIPIWSPPGPRGIQPGISLNYSSTSGIGSLGIGWAIGGLGAIARCNKTVAQDGTAVPVALVTADGYCLNGNRLRLTAGTYGADASTYQTEVADFSLITANGTAGNGPAYFTVQGRNGLTYEYGYTDPNSNGANSQVLAPGSTPSTASIWYLSKVMDRSGNNYVVNYTAVTGDAVPSTIKWTPVSEAASTYTYSMQFNYSSNVPQSSPYKYVAGTVSNNNELLTSITITDGSTVLKDYFLKYQTSSATGRKELQTITECADTAESNCLLPTTVGYSSASAGVSMNSTATNLSNIVSTKYDFNGDGIPDIVYQGSSTYYVAFGSTGGYGTLVNTGIAITSGPLLYGNLVNGTEDGILANNGGTWYYYTSNGSSFTGVSTGLAYDSTAYMYQLADINGDGLPDLISLYFNASAKTVTIDSRLNSTSGTAPSFSTTLSTGYTASGIAEVFLVQPSGKLRKFDFNGDGRDDLVLTTVVIDGTQKMVQTYELLSNGNTFTVYYIADVQEQNTITIPPVAFVNWNDDRCTDYVFNSTLYLSGCNGSVPSSVVLSGTVVGAMDWDGDGRTDLLVSNGTDLAVYLSSGTSATSTIQPTNITYSSNWVYYILDANGDGLDDVGVVASGGDLFYYPHNGQSDLVTSIADGYGVTFTPSYVPLAASGGVYAKGGSVSLPDQSYDSSRGAPGEPRWIVASYLASDGIGGQYTTSYQYTQAVTNVQGRGFQGFGQIRTLDSRNSISDTRNYSVLFPTTGMITAESVTQSSGKNISVYTPHITTVTAGTASNQRYFNYDDTQTTQSYELGGTDDGVLIKTQVTTRNTPDAYGNFSSVETSLTDNDSASPFYNDVWTTTTATTTTANPSTWCNSLPSEVDVTNTAPGMPSITRHSGFTSDYTNCRDSASVVESGNSTYQVNTGYSYDGFGNVKAQTVTGVGMAPRTSSIIWGTTGQFPVSSTNAIAAAGSANAQTTQFNFDPDFGGPLSIKDPNGISMSWQYDPFGRKMTETHPDGTSATWSYAACQSCDPMPRLVVTEQLLDKSAHLITQSVDYFDMYSRQIYQLDTLLSGATTWSTRNYFDSLGRVASAQFPYLSSGSAGASQTYYYDNLNRLTQVQRPISATNSTLQSTNYQYQGGTTIVTDPQLKVTKTIAQVTGSLARTQDNNGYYVNFAHDAFGSVTSVTDSASNTLRTMTYGYGIKPFLTSVTDMDLGAQSWTIDALGEATQHSDAKHQNLSAIYDALSRMTSRTEPDLTTTWTWGATAANFNIGRLASVSSTASVGGTYSESYVFDSVGRLSTKTVGIPSVASNTFQYSYDPNTGFLATMLFPFGYPSSYRVEVAYTYQNGILSQLSNALSPTTIWWQATAVNPRGQVTQENTGDATSYPRIVSDHTFDAVTGWLGSVQTGVSGGSGLQNEAFLYDEMGNVTQRQNNNLGLTENYHYDNLYRLDHSVLGSVTNLQMGYDSTGNITSRSDVAGGAPWTYDPGHKHQVTQAGSTAYTYTYDANGNAISRNGSSVSWTSYNYPSGVSTSTESATFDYGPDRQRWRMIYSGPSGSETTYYAAPEFEIVATSSATDYRHYLSANGRPVVVISRMTNGAVAVRSLLTDHQGSISELVTDQASTPSVYAAESFTPYGNRREASTWSGQPTTAERTAMDGVTREGYTFQTVLGAMGLNHMSGRIQDAVTGRFLSADPVRSQPFSTQGWNPYSYVNNNPMSFVDPSGFEEIPDGYDDNGGLSSGGDADEAGEQISTTSQSSSTESPIVIQDPAKTPNIPLDQLVVTPPSDAFPASTSFVSLDGGLQSLTVTGTRHFGQTPQYTTGSLNACINISVLYCQSQSAPQSQQTGCTKSTGPRSTSNKITDAIVGFGDAFLIPILVRNLTGIGNGTVDTDSSAYQGGEIAGVIEGLIPLALESAAAYSAGQAARGTPSIINANPYFRIGPGRFGGDMVPRISSPYLPGDGHINLSTRLPPVPPLGPLALNSGC